MAVMELQAGVAVGHYKLGMTLFECINLLRASSTHTSLTWDSTRPSSSYILLTVSPSASLSLVFSGSTQRLLTIEVAPPSIASLTWQGKALLPPEQRDTDGQLNVQRLLHGRFGPTYAPTPHPSNSDELVLSYPGIYFSFAEKTGGDDPPLKRVLVAAKPKDGERPPPFPDVLQLGQGSAQPVLSEGVLEPVHITLGDEISPTKIALRASGSEETSPIEIQLHESSSEDLLCDLGSPTRTYWKEDDRLAIHLKQTGGKDMPNAYFFNYFSLGLDFMLDPTSHRIIKIILHSNTPGEVLFGRYAKCRWRIERTGTARSVTSEDEVEQLKACLAGDESNSTEATNKPTQRREQAMVLDRAADSKDGLRLDRPTELVAYPGTILEVTQSGEVETLWLV